MLTLGCIRHKLNFLDPRVFVPFILKETILFLIGIVIMTFYLIIIIFSSPIYAFRFLVNKTSKYFDPNLGKMVTARAQFLATEHFTAKDKAPRSNIVTAWVVEGQLSVSEVKATLQNNLLPAKDETGIEKYPEVKQYVTTYMGFKFWKWDSNFSLDNHVKLFENDDDQFTDHDRRDLIEVLVNQPFRPNQSPWEILIVNNYVNPELRMSRGSNLIGKSLFLLRYHHCLADGFGAMYTFLGAMFSQQPVIPKPRFIFRRSFRQYFFKMTYPFRAIREISQFMVISMRSNPWKIRDNKKAWKQLYQNSPTIPISHIKAIKTRFGVRFSSVLQSCAAAGMSKCLDVKYGKQVIKDLGNMPCAVMLPLPGHPRKLRNHCTGACVEIPINDMDPVQRLLRCDENFLSVKRSTMPSLGKVLPVIGGSMFAPMTRFLATNRSLPVTFSNFPVGETKYEICGGKVLQASGPAAGVTGLGFLGLSYLDSIQIGVVGEQAIFSSEDLNLIIQGIMDELDILHKHSTV